MAQNILHINDRKGQYPNSYYAATMTALPPFPVLQGAHKADICIIGAGYTGLSAALHLAQKGRKVIVLEAQRVGFGASGRNGGQVGSGQRLDQASLEKLTGRENARRYWDLAQDAKALVKQLIDTHHMPVTFHKGIAHACLHQKDLRAAHQDAEKLARDYGYDEIDLLDQKSFFDVVPSPLYQGGVIDWGAGHIHPLNFAVGLAKAAHQAGALIYEQSEALRIDHGPKVTVHTESGQVSADHLILACNGYLGNLEPKIAAKVMPINNFIIATRPLGDLSAQVLTKRVAVADSKFVINYWHLSNDNRLLFGGGESYGWKFPDIVKTVTKPLYEVYPHLKNVDIDYAWGGTLAITMNRLPCFNRPYGNVFSASGYSGHGVALATLAGKLLAETIGGESDGFDLMARLPQYRFPGGAALRWPLLALAMRWYALRDRLGL